MESRSLAAIDGEKVRLGTAGKRAANTLEAKRFAARRRGEVHGVSTVATFFFLFFFLQNKAFIQVQKDAWLKSRALCIKNSVYFMASYVRVAQTRRRPLCNSDRFFRLMNLLLLGELKVNIPV